MKNNLPFKNLNMPNTKTTKVILIVYFLLLCAMIYGWFANLVYLFGMLGGDVNALFIARVVGLFLAPMGAILGYYP